MKDIKMFICIVSLFLLCPNISYTQNTPEFLIDTSIVFGPSYDFQGNTEIAFDGTNYLAVWEFDRNGNTNIRGTFIDQSGRVLNPYGFNITNTSDNHLTPDVAFDGTNYLVVWCEEKMNPDNRDIIGTRITTEGEILDPEGIKISAAPEDQDLPSITFGGSYYFISWCDSRDTTTRGSRVNTFGEVQDSLGIIISSQIEWNIRKKNCVISDGTNYLACWYKTIWGEIHGNCATLINQSGEVLDTIEILITDDPFLMPNWEVSLAFDGDNYFFVGNIGIDYKSVVGIRINKFGSIIDTIVISDGVTSSVSYNDGYYLVGYTRWGWGGDFNLYARRVDKSGTLLDSTAINITNFNQWEDIVFDHQIASDGTNSLIIWHNANVLKGSRVDKYGMVLDPDGVIISTHPNSQFTPTVTSDGPNYFIVWNDSRYNFWDIYGTRIDQQGNNLNPNGVYIHNISEEYNPRVAFGGSYYMAVWIGYEPTRNICRARIDQSGILLDTSNVAINGGEWVRPLIASDGDKYLVVVESEASHEIYGLILNQSGTVISSFPISTTIGGHKYFPRTVFNGSNYLVVWFTERYPSGFDIHGTLIDSNGIVLQPNGIEIFRGEGDQCFPSAASNGTDYLIVWQDNYNICGARLDSSGTPTDTIAIPISLAEGDQEYPVVAYNGSEYVVVWQDNRNGVDYDIYGARVSTDGELIDSFVVSNAIGDQLSPEIAYSSHHQVLVVYSGWTGEYEGKIYDCMRIWGKILDVFIPVELISFTATEQQGKVNLHWTTSTETNNLEFEIERKIINEGAEEEWIKIGFRKGAGTTTESQEYSYVDDISTTTTTATSLAYRLKQIDYDGSYEYSDEILVGNSISIEYDLYQNYPNPFNPMTTIQYSIKVRSNVELILYDILGSQVKVLVNEEQDAGYYKVNFNSGSLASGIYFYRIQAGDFVETKKMVLLH